MQHQPATVTNEQAKSGQVLLLVNGHLLAMFNGQSVECQHVNDAAYLLARLVPESVLQEARRIQEERQY